MRETISLPRRFALGRVRAATPWRAQADFAARDRETTAEALRREAAEYGADGVAGVAFEIEECRGEWAGVTLRRLVATGEAVRHSLTA